MAKKKKQEEAGAPAWMITYGDMMTLLLCFFVIIVSFSDIKKEDQFRAVVQEIQKAFGLRGGGGKVQTQDDPARSMVQRLINMRLYSKSTPTRSNTDQPGIDGSEPNVTTIRPGPFHPIGGVVHFEPGSANLSSDARQTLDQFMVKSEIQGVNHVIEVLGHADPMELTRAHQQTDSAVNSWNLSYERARNVMEYLTRHARPLDPDRFRIIVNGPSDVVQPRALTVLQQAANRRVELRVIEEIAKPKEQSAFEIRPITSTESMHSPE